MNNLHDISQFIDSLELATISDTQHMIIDRLCKKIDVSKCIKKAYDYNMLSVTNDSNITSEELESLACKMIEYYKAFKNYKVLNSVLKLSDDILYAKQGLQISDNLKNTIRTLLS